MVLHDFIKKIPNILTVSRIVIIPLVLICLYFQTKFSNQLAAILFIIAGITDFFDGYLARAFESQSRLGRFLDPIADKLLVVACLVVLVHYERAAILPTLAIICREILVSGLREFLAEINVSVPVSKTAKIKTGMQMLALVLLLLGEIGSGYHFVDILGSMLLWIAAALTLFTGYAYLQAGLKHMGQ